MARPGSPRWIREQLASKERLSDRRLQNLLRHGRHVELVACELLREYEDGCENAARLLGVQKNPANLQLLLDTLATAAPDSQLYDDILEALTNYGDMVLEPVLTMAEKSSQRTPFLEFLVTRAFRDPRILSLLEVAILEGDTVATVLAALYGNPALLPALSRQLDASDPSPSDKLHNLDLRELGIAIERLGGELSSAQQLKLAVVRSLAGPDYD